MQPIKIEDLPLDVREGIRKSLQAGRKLDAVKLYYNETGASLLESKSIIEQEIDLLSSKCVQSDSEPGASSDDMDQMLDLIFAHKKLDAVKIQYQLSGSSLREAKKVCRGIDRPAERRMPRAVSRWTQRSSSMCQRPISVGVDCLGSRYCVPVLTRSKQVCWSIFNIKSQ